MNTFEKAGEAMILAEEGNLLISRAIVSAIKGWAASFKAWLGAMPTTLPPTEAPHR